MDINYFLGNDYEIVADSDQAYSISVAKEELEFIKEIRKYNSLYSRIISDPKRCAELIDMKMR